MVAGMVMRGWVLDGCVLCALSFMFQHAGGESETLAVVGENATAEYNMMHCPDMIEECPFDAVVGAVGTSKASMAMGAAMSALSVVSVQCVVVAKLDAGGDWKLEAYGGAPGVLLVKARAYASVFCYQFLGGTSEVRATISSSKNLETLNDRAGLARSAAFVIFIIVVSAVKGLHVISGPSISTGAVN